MPDQLPDVHPGDRPSAEWSNAVKDAATRSHFGAAANASSHVLIPHFPNQADVVRRFELKDELAPATGTPPALGNEVTAYLLEWNGSGYTPNTDIEFEVLDANNELRGRAKSAYSSPHHKGSRGYARLMADSGKWEITKLTPHALAITGLLTQDETGGGSFEIDNVTIDKPTGAILVEDQCDTNPTSNITIQNPHGMEGDNNGECYAVWDETGNHWNCRQLTCPS